LNLTAASESATVYDFHDQFRDDSNKHLALFGRIFASQRAEQPLGLVSFGYHFLEPIELIITLAAASQSSTYTQTSILLVALNVSSC
jgi:hypothetical protein